MQHGYGVSAKRVLLCGYFGYGNMGDDASLLSAIRHLRQRGVSVTVSYSRTGDFSECASLGASRCDRLSLRRMSRAIEECDAVIFSGGNHFENESSRRSLLYYSLLAIAAQRQKKPTLMLSSGLGEMRSGIDRAVARAALSRFSFAGLRTEGDLCEGRGLFSCSIRSIPDLALSFPVISSEKQDSFAIIPRRDSAVMLKTAKRLRACGLTPVVIPLFIGEDSVAARGFGEALGCEVFVSQNTNEIRRRLSTMRLTLTERLHGAIFSTTSSTPFMIEGSAKKCRRFAEETETRAAKLNTPSPFLRNPEDFATYSSGSGTDFSALCDDFSAEIFSGIEHMLCGCGLN